MKLCCGNTKKRQKDLEGLSDSELLVLENKFNFSAKDVLLYKQRFN